MAADDSRRAAGPPGPSGPATDRERLERLRTGDETALDELVGRYWRPLVVYARRVLGGSGSDDAAQDLVQEAFIRLWRRRDDLSPPLRVRPLLYRIVRNLALNENRDRARRREILEARRTAVPAPSQTTPLQDAEANELESAIRAAIGALPARRREVFELARFDGLTYREIADVMDISPQTVANQMSRALATLRDALSDHLPRPDPPPDASPHTD